MAIRYMITAYIDTNGKYSEKTTDFAIHDVIRCVEGTINDNLPLMPYRLQNIFTLLDRDGLLRRNDHVMERLEKHQKIKSGSIIVIHDDNLYGVVIKNYIPHVIGIVRYVLTSINSAKPENCLILDDLKCLNGQPKMVKSHDVVYEPESQILITIPLGGHCFVQFHNTTDGSGDEGQQTDSEIDLVLLVGTSFLVVNDVPLKWIRYKDCYLKETYDCSLDYGKVLFMYNGGLVPEEGGHFCIHGLGPRNSNYNEAYYYALMHVGESFCKQPTPID